MWRYCKLQSQWRSTSSFTWFGETKITCISKCIILAYTENITKKSEIYILICFKILCRTKKIFKYDDIPKISIVKNLQSMEDIDYVNDHLPNPAMVCKVSTLWQNSFNSGFDGHDEWCEISDRSSLC